jgi:hypothetical protein
MIVEPLTVGHEQCIDDSMADPSGARRNFNVRYATRASAKAGRLPQPLGPVTRARPWWLLCDVAVAHIRNIAHRSSQTHGSRVR